MAGEDFEKKVLIKTLVRVYGTEAKPSEIEEEAATYGFSAPETLKEITSKYRRIAEKLEAWIDQEEVL